MIAQRCHVDDASIYHEDVPWDLADIRLLSPMARAQAGSSRFRDRRRDTLGSVGLQSCRMGGDDTDGLVELAGSRRDG